MATRKLSRVIVEGGRHKSQRVVERARTRSERQTVRRLLNHPSVDCIDDEVMPHRSDRSFFGKEFADRIRPLVRWMAKQAGRPWAKVWSELTTANDRRTTKGRHLLDHARGLVVFAAEVERWWRRYTIGRPDKFGFIPSPFADNQFFVDARGILHHYRNGKLTR